MTESYDVVVIGGGTAGSNAARSALKAGATRVALVYLPSFFNTCIQMGCMPSKSLIAAAHQGLSFQDAVARMEGHIKRLEKSLEDKLSEDGYEIIIGRASFASGGNLLVENDGDKRELSGKRYVIAVGSKSFIPPVPGLRELPKEYLLTSDDVVSLDHIKEAPSSLIIVGDGPIGLEMATVFSAFGTKIDILDRSKPLSRMDPEFGEELEKILEADPNITLHKSASIVEVAQENGKLRFTVDKNGTEEMYEAEKVLVATGRKPVFDDLNIEHVNVTTERGHIMHDKDTLVTLNPDIYVAGDVTGAYQILHFASEMGKVAGYNAAVGKPERAVPYERLSMAIIFFNPEAYEIASMGLTEQAAKEQGIETVNATIRFPEVGRGILENRSFGLWKITVAKEDGRILGTQVIGPMAEALVDIIAWIMHFNGTARDLFEKIPYYHPTYPELLQSLGREICKKLNEESDTTICPEV